MGGAVSVVAEAEAEVAEMGVVDPGPYISLG